MTDLSPAAQAVLDAFGTYPLRADHISEDLVPALAAALRAASHEVVPVPIKAKTPEEHWALLSVKNRMLAIADEFEAL